MATTAESSSNSSCRPPKSRGSSNSDHGQQSPLRGAAASAMFSSMPNLHPGRDGVVAAAADRAARTSNGTGSNRPGSNISSRTGGSYASRRLCLSRDETLLVSASGDVVSCRCRNSGYPSCHEGSIASQSWQEECAVLCCDQATDCDDLSTQLQDPTNAFCSFGSTASTSARPRVGGRQQKGGLLGGAPAAPPQSPAAPFSAAAAAAGFGVGVKVSPEPAPDSRRKEQQNGSDGGGLNGGGGLFSESKAENPEPNLTVVNPQKARQAFRSQPLRSPMELAAATVENRDLDVDNDDDDGSIVPIRSFDYSHFADGGNDMLPDNLNPSFNVEYSLELRQAASHSPKTDKDDFYNQNNNAPPFFHGVPTFLQSFQQIKVNQVSAHPLGSHVLLTSAEGLLFSYGLNDYGQLGIGVQTPVAGFHRGYIMTPTIVTPLVENGGKAIACAAGVDHSLVVVMTEERRLVKSRSFEPPSSPPLQDHSHQQQQAGRTTASSSPPPRGNVRRDSTTESVAYHQIYGFGRNDHMKIGLVSPKLAQFSGPENEMEAVVLPRRVALRCKVRPNNSYDSDGDDDHSDLPPAGIFSISASKEHSAALVRRASGDVELYTWGNATYGALGLPQPATSPLQTLVPNSVQNSNQQRNGTGKNRQPQNQHPQVNVAPVPSFVSTLSSTSNPDAVASSLLLADEGEYPTRVALGRRCSFVLTSLGRCFSFGTSDEGMLGLGPKISETHRPSEIGLPVEFRGDRLTCVSAGASHVLACSESGRVLSWGCHEPIGKRESPASAVTSPIQHPQQSKTHPHQQNGSVNTQLDAESDGRIIVWSPQPVELERTWTGSPTHNFSRRRRHNCPEDLLNESSCLPQITEVCAGNDCSVFVTQTGRVLSCGRNSGRLGLGDVREDTVHVPRPMFGGLRLWQEHDRKKIQSSNHLIDSTAQVRSASVPRPRPMSRHASVS